MNKHGFTLVELLSTIVIIALIAGIAVIAYNGVVDSASDSVFDAYMKSMHAEAAYYMSNINNQVTFNGNTARLNIFDDLRMDPINNPKNSSDLCATSYVDVIKERDSNSGVLSITYNVCLKCLNSGFDKCEQYVN